MTFHGEPRHTQTPHESAWVVWLPLVILAIPSIGLGWWLAPHLFGNAHWLASSVAANAWVFNVDALLRHEQMMPLVERLISLPFACSILGLVVAYLAYVRFPSLPTWCAQRFRWVHQALCANWF